MLPCSSLPSVARPKRSPGKYTAGGGKQVPFGPAGVSVISFLGIARLFLWNKLCGCARTARCIVSVRVVVAVEIVPAFNNEPF